MRRAKIVCTIGPASLSKETIRQMIKAGMDVARLNFSHGSHETHGKAIEIIREESEKAGKPIAILQDLRGLKLRVELTKGGTLELKKGKKVILTNDHFSRGQDILKIKYPYLIQELNTDNIVLIADGLIQLRIIRKEGHFLEAEVIEGGIVKGGEGVNLPGVRIRARTFTKKDKDDLDFGIKRGVDLIALSFVQSGADVLSVKRYIKKYYKKDLPLIAKIETASALENIDEIINVADGIMIARGDLGVEIPPEEVPVVQKKIIEKCNAALRPVITATQMLESMTKHLRPTRAEANDVANAVLDGTDALMLSAETAMGRYPVEAVKMMNRIITYTESRTQGRLIPPAFKSVAEAVAKAACTSSEEIETRGIAAFTKSGFTALLVSKLRPKVPIFGLTESRDTVRRMNLYWGVIPILMEFPKSTDEMIKEAEGALLRHRAVKKGDMIVIIATSPFSSGAKTNIMKIHEIKG